MSDKDKRNVAPVAVVPVVPVAGAKAPGGQKPVKAATSGPTAASTGGGFFKGRKAVTPVFVPEPDQPLNPHRFRPEVEIIGERLPRVLISLDAYKHMCLYVDIAQKEVGWLGAISRTASGDFYIEETFLLEQEVHETETELSSDAIGKLTMDLLSGGDGGLERANKLRFWGHSHVHMSTGPSGTDERTMDRFGREGNPWYVRGIFNKYGHAEFTVYLFDRGLRINDAPWTVWDAAKNQPIKLERRRFGALTELVVGASELIGKPVTPLVYDQAPSPELRAAVEAEFVLKVKERRGRFWGRVNNWLTGDDELTNLFGGVDETAAAIKPAGAVTTNASPAPQSTPVKQEAVVAPPSPVVPVVAPLPPHSGDDVQ